MTQPVMPQPKLGEKIVEDTIDCEKVWVLVDIYTKDRLPELVERVRNGNTKLSDAWNQIKTMPEANEDQIKAKAKARRNWLDAMVKLKAYCDQLKELGFNECPYIVASKKTKPCLGDKIICYVCPSTTDYWSGELLTERSPE